jgi:hypothetical protein
MELIFIMEITYKRPCILIAPFPQISLENQSFNLLTNPLVFLGNQYLDLIFKKKKKKKENYILSKHSPSNCTTCRN